LLGRHHHPQKSATKHEPHIHTYTHIEVKVPAVRPLSTEEIFRVLFLLFKEGVKREGK